MRIGIDLDNTIACYDGVFHAAALELGLVPEALAPDKTSVRDHLRETGCEDAWTRLQGHVYGARMNLVSCYPGCLDFMRRAAQDGHGVFVISHKTRHPYRGPRHDLHAAALGFLARHRIPAEHAFFEPTQDDKRARIAAQGCDVFIDDLPEFLADCPPSLVAHPILFDPQGRPPGAAWRGHRFQAFADWPAIEAALLGPASRHAA
jgi:hypothetical protein